jgi:uncharacterized protein (UPF0261 family)
MVNFFGPDAVPPKFKGRIFYEHNPQATLMRTDAEECAQLGRILGVKLNISTGPVAVMIPKKAISVISAPGQPFHDPSADQALFDEIRANLRKDIEVLELDCEINDPVFAETAARKLLELMGEKLPA